MALKPTIYKLRIALSDLERNYYDSLSLTVALHPSETPQRLMARVLAYCLNAQPELTFCKGLSDIDEPDIWLRTLDDKTLLWIEMGEPAIDRVKKVSRLAETVKIYSFNSKSDVWWSQNQSKLNQLKAAIYRFDALQINDFADLLSRTMDFSVTITGESAYIATSAGELEVSWQTLKS